MCDSVPKEPLTYVRSLEGHLQKYMWMTSSSISVEIQSYSKNNNNQKELFKFYGSSG